VVFVSGDYVIRQGEFSPGMVFLSDGEVEVIADTGEEEGGQRKSALITTLGPHSFFGEMSLLDGLHKSTASIRVPDFCEGWLLAVEAYHQVVSKYPTFKNYLKSVAMLRLQNTISNTGGGEDYNRRMSEMKTRIENDHLVKPFRRSSTHKSGQWDLDELQRRSIAISSPDGLVPGCEGAQAESSLNLPFQRSSFVASPPGQGGPQMSSLANESTVWHTAALEDSVTPTGAGTSGTQRV